MKGLVLTYAITVLASIGALRRPLIGLYAYVGFAVLRPQFLFSWAGDMSSLSLVLGLSLLAGWALNGFGTWRLGRSSPVVYALFIFTAGYIVSASVAEYKDASFRSVLELLKIVLPFCVGLTMIQNERQWRPLVWIIVLSQGYVGFEQNLNYLRGYNSAAIGFGGMDNNCFGVSLVTVLGLAIALVLTSRKWYERTAAVASAALILHTTLLTYSRGAMIGLIVVGVVAFAVLPKRPKYLAIMVLVALVAFRFVGPQLLERYASAFASSDERDGSAESRIDLWKDTLKVIQAQPILGVGPANWRLIASRFGWSEGKSAHSVWMETAAEVGVPTTLALFLFFCLAAYRLWSLARAKVDDTNYLRVGAAIGVMLSVAGFVSSGQFVSVVGLEAPYYIVMIGAALLKNPVLTISRSTANEARSLVDAPVQMPSVANMPQFAPVTSANAAHVAPTGPGTSARRLLPDLATAQSRETVQQLSKSGSRLLPRI